MPADVAPPPIYRFANLIRDLEKGPLEDGGYELRLGEIGQNFTPPIERPGAMMGGTFVQLPTRQLCRSIAATESTGSNLTISSIERVAEAVRPELVFGRLGIPTRTLKGQGPISFPVIQPAAVNGGWSREGAPGTERQPTVKSVESAPKIAISWVQFSRQLMQQAEALETDLLQELTAATEGLIESGFIAGRGVENEPHGLLLQATGAASYGATVPTYQELVAQLKTYTAAHGTLRRARWLVHSDMATDLLNVEKVASTGRFAADIDQNDQLRILGIRAEISDYMPTDKILLLDPLAVRTTWWGDPYAHLNLWTDLMDVRYEARLLVWNSCDVAVKHPQLLVVGGAA